MAIPHQARRVAAFTTLMLIIAGCSSPAASASSPPATASVTPQASTVASAGAPSSAAATEAASSAPGDYDATIAALVPDAVRAKGTIVVGSDATYPPFESIGADGTTIVGFDADMANAIGKVLGLKVELTNVPFDSLLPGIGGGRYDMALSSIGDTKVREETMDFVTYYWNGTAALVAAGNPMNLVANSLCGVRVGVERGSLQQSTMLPDQATACQAAGKAAPIENAFKGAQESQLALSSGRIDAVLADAITLEIAAQASNGKLEVIGPVSRNSNPGGVALPKGSALTNAVHAAMQKLMADGTYTKIISQWGMQNVAIDSTVIDGAVK
jgi:polar amino acid transport system substrate-binding protein